MTKVSFLKIVVGLKNLVQYSICIACAVLLISKNGFAATYNISEEQNSTFNSFGNYGDILNISSGGSIEVTGGAHGVNGGQYEFQVNIDADADDGIIVDNGYAITANTAEIGGFDVNLNSGKIYSNNKAIVLVARSDIFTNFATINTAAGTLISGSNSAIEIALTNVTIDNAGVISSDNDAIYINHINNSSNFEYTTTITNSGEINGNITIDNDNDDSATLTNNSGAINGNITLGSGFASSVTLNDGTINGDITLGHVDQTVNLNGGNYIGTIQGNASSLGTVNVNGNMTLASSSKIGDSNAVETLNINDGANFTANGSIYVDVLNLNSGGKLVLGNDNIIVNGSGVITVAGTLDFGDDNRTISGFMINGSGAGVVDFGNGSHSIQDFYFNSGDTIAVDLSQESHGNITADVVGLGSGVKLITRTGENYQYVADGDRRKIVDGGSGSIIYKIEDENINADREFSVLKHSTNVESEAGRTSLYLYTSRDSASEVTTNTNAQAIYNSVNNVGGQATGELKDFQQYLDSATNRQQVTSALKSVLPQHGGGVIRNNINNASNSARILENRFNQQRLAAVRPVAKPRIYTKNNVQATTRSNAPRVITTTYRLMNNSSQNQAQSTQGNRFKFNSGKSFGDDEDHRAIWGQVFGVSAKQSATTGDGYQSKSKGFAFGYDTKIAKDRNVGINFSYATSTVESSDALKKTDIDTYQVNLYHGKNFNKYFLDTLIGFAWNEYQSNRAIPVIGQSAKASFSGQTYLAKTTFGQTHYLGSGFSIIPQVSLNFIHNNIAGYEEKGAGTLGLEVASSNSNFLEGRVGVELDHYVINSMGSTINTQIRTSYGYDLIGEEQSIRSNFVGQTATFNTAVSKVDRKSFMIGAGISLVNRNDISLNLDYNFEKKASYTAHSGLVKAKYGF